MECMEMGKWEMGTGVLAQMEVTQSREYLGKLGDRSSPFLHPPPALTSEWHTFFSFSLARLRLSWMVGTYICILVFVSVSKRRSTRKRKKRSQGRQQPYGSVILCMIIEQRESHVTGRVMRGGLVRGKRKKKTTTTCRCEQPEGTDGTLKRASSPPAPAAGVTCMTASSFLVIRYLRRELTARRYRRTVRWAAPPCVPVQAYPASRLP